MAGLLGQSGGPSKATRRRAKSAGNLERYVHTGMGSYLVTLEVGNQLIS